MDLTNVAWRKSSHSGSNGGDCVEVAAFLGEKVAIRDSKNPTGPVLTFSTSDWTAFLNAVKSGTAV
jgi:hypothetical protein